MIVVIKKKQILKFLACALIIFLILASYVTVGVVSVSGEVKKKPVYSVDTDEKVVALSFDAAWGADKTQKIMEILLENNIPATFFLVGFWVDKYPEQVKELVNKGFDIGNHSHNHLKMSTLSEESILDEISYVNSKVKELTNYSPTVFRAPFGDYNNRLIDVVSSNGMVPVQWSVDTLDWKGTRPTEILARVKSKIKSGGIILFHNNSDYVVEALPIVIDYLLSEGYTFKSVSELVYHSNYTVDINGVQHKN